MIIFLLGWTNLWPSLGVLRSDLAMKIFLVGLADLRCGLAKAATIRLPRHRVRETCGWGA
jgi:hypothetical protein